MPSSANATFMLGVIATAAPEAAGIVATQLRMPLATTPEIQPSLEQTAAMVIALPARV